MKNILLVGLGRFGRHIAQELHALGHMVLAVDRNEERVNRALPFLTNAQIGDSTSEAFLSSLGVRDFDVCIVTISHDFQNSLETTSLLKELGAKLVVSRAERDVQAKFLLRNGADQVVYPEEQMAKWTAIRYTADHILDYIEVDDLHAIFEVEVPEGWRGKSVGHPEKVQHQHCRHQAGRAHQREHQSGHGADRGDDHAGAGRIQGAAKILSLISAKSRITEFVMRLHL